MKLSPRLEAIAAQVKEGARIVDVGADHGLLSIYLAQRAHPVSIVATDLRPGPLGRAREHIHQAGLEDRIRLCLCDGLEGVSPQEADTIIIAGMGGETIMGILARSSWALEGDRRLLLAPQSKQELLRQWLYDRGCGIRSEHLVEDEGKLYPFFCAGGPVGRPFTAAELLIGRWPAERRNVLFYRYLGQLLEKLRREKRGLEQGDRERSALRLSETEALLHQLQRMEREDQP